MNPKYERAVFFGDFHIPFEDANSVRIAIDFCQWFKPHYIFLMGDVCDFYAISRFDKDPERVFSLQDDVENTHDLLERFRRTCPRAKMVYLCGNHEFRLLKWKWQHPEVSKMKALNYREMFGLDALKIEWVDYLQEYVFHDFVVEHGDIVRKHSGYTARGMMEKRGCSGISAHSHRLGTHYLTNYGGDFVWLENGCMCSRNPEWMKRPNWQNGFSVGWFKHGQDRFTTEQICICDGKCVYKGKEFPNPR